MKKLRLFSVISLLAILAAVALNSSGEVQAWGPERTLFTNEAPATYVTFNSITNNAAIGDERDFVRIVEIGTGKVYTNEVEVRGGKEYQVYIFYHNNASSTFNTGDYNYSGVAREARMASQFPMQIAAGQKGVVSATISASNANPAKVWDEAYMTATETVDLAYKVGSAKIYNDWDTNGSVLSERLFTSQGTYLGLNELNGVLLGCEEFSGQVVYTLVATKVGGGDPEPPQPVEPDPPQPVEPTTPQDPGEPTPDPTPGEQPGTPGELPQAGPAEIALAIVIVLGLVAWGVYYWRSKKTFNKMRSDVIGDKDGDDKNIS